jgi:hypothetical protein
MQQLPILEKTYDLIKWYVPILNRLPRDHKYALGDRLIANLYTLLESLIQAQYERDKLSRLQSINTQLEVIRYQTRLLHDFELIHVPRYEHAAKVTNEIGTALGGWIKQQHSRQSVSDSSLVTRASTIAVS